MKVLKSLKSAKLRDKDCKIIKRHGKTFVINKKNPRLKARQG
jgi:large subunit ribosomal protein L36